MSQIIRPRPLRLLAAMVCVVCVAAVAGALARVAGPRPAVAATVDVLGAERLSWLTGPESKARTDQRWNVYATDLGHPVLHEGELHLVFGDTWGRTGPEGSDWRSSTMARVASTDPRDGLVITDMVTGPDGEATELLSSKKVDGVEKTVIPTHAISVEDRLVLHYMSVRRWLTPGRWEVGHAGFAVSTDDGATWSVPAGSRTSVSGGFAQVAMVASGEHVLVFGIPAGRFGGVRLARATPETLHLPATHEFWTGSAWSADVVDAAVVVPGPVGELSVQWNPYLERWLMMYLDEHRRAIVMRTAPSPTGPWAGAVVVTTASRHPQLYAPYIVPGAETGADLYFTMSQFGPYQVALMRTSVEGLVTNAAVP